MHETVSQSIFGNVHLTAMHVEWNYKTNNIRAQYYVWNSHWADYLLNEAASYKIYYLTAL